MAAHQLRFEPTLSVVVTQPFLVAFAALWVALFVCQ